MSTKSSDGFYMTLPSDGSMDTYPHNTLSHYSIHTFQPVDLSEGEWELGMTEMIFPTSLDNISEDEAFMDFLCPEMENALFLEDPYTIYDTGRFKMHQVYSIDYRIPGGTMDIDQKAVQFQRECLVTWDKSDWKPTDRLKYTNQKFQIYRIRFRPGPYPKLENLINEMNEGIKLTFSRVWRLCGSKAYKTEFKFEFDPLTKKVKYITSDPVLKEKYPFAIRIAQSLAHKLGFGPELDLVGPDAREAVDDYEIFQGGEGFRRVPHCKWININYHGPHAADLYQNLKELYVYCDIIEPQMVGGNVLKLLRLVSMPHQKEEMGGGGRWDPMQVQYMKLGKKYFDSISIEIRNPLGQFMPFNSGRTCIVLHFRKIY